MPKFTINPAPKPATAWSFRGKVVFPGKQIEIDDADVERLTKRGMIGEVKPVKASDVPTQANLVPGEEAKPGVREIPAGQLPDIRDDDRAEKNRNKPGRNARSV